MQPNTNDGYDFLSSESLAKQREEYPVPNSTPDTELANLNSKVADLEARLKNALHEIRRLDDVAIGRDNRFMRRVQRAEALVEAVRNVLDAHENDAPDAPMHPLYKEVMGAVYGHGPKAGPKSSAPGTSLPSPEDWRKRSNG